MENRSVRFFSGRREEKTKTYGSLASFVISKRGRKKGGKKSREQRKEQEKKKTNLRYFCDLSIYLCDSSTGE